MYTLPNFHHNFRHYRYCLRLSAVLLFLAAASLSAQPLNQTARKTAAAAALPATCYSSTQVKDMLWRNSVGWYVCTAANTWTAAGGGGTVTSVGNGTIGSLFTASWATATTTPALSLNFAAAAANCFIAGPSSGGNAVPTCRAIVAGDLPSTTVTPGSYTLSSITVDAQGRLTAASSGSGAAAPFADSATSASFKGTADATKLLAFSLAGMTTGTTNTVFSRNRGLGTGAAPAVDDSLADSFFMQSATGNKALVVQMAVNSPSKAPFSIQSVGGSDVFRYDSSGLLLCDTNATGCSYLGRANDGLRSLTSAANAWSTFNGSSFRATSAGCYTFSSGSNPESGQDLFICRSAAGIITFGTTAGATNAWPVDAGECYVASDQTNATTTLASTTCSITVVNGRKYAGVCELFLSDSVAADGAKIDFNGGSATMSNFRAQITAFDTALNLSSQTTALNSAASASTFTGNGAFEIHLALEPSSDGTFIPQFAQVAHTAGTLTLARGSHCTFKDTP